MEKSSHLKIKQLDFFVREMRALLTETKVCTVQMQVTSQMRQSQTGKGEIVARKVCGVVGIILEGCLTNRPPKEVNHKLRYFDINPFRPKRSIYD